jgi:ATP-dependent Clp protease adaptor protein ClpS|tara:strand:- start:3974 stop:4369 length:396 start_codon:yes stop_codon:yes gene_type:complete
MCCKARATALNNVHFIGGALSLLAQSEMTPGTETVQAESLQEDLEKTWQLILEDDDYHTYQYVIEMLGSIFGYGPEKSFALAKIVDTEGSVVLYTGSKELCEQFQDEVHGYGADPRMEQSVGSMTAYIKAI